jgi:hypothetical protein
MGFMNNQELSKLMSGLLDGTLSAEEQAQLEGVLEKDREARLLYMQYVDLDIELSLLSKAALPARKMPRRIRWELAAAAVLLFGVLLGIFSIRHSAETRRPANITAPASWSEDFASEKAEGWVGQWTTNGAPGAKGALTSITLTNSYGVFHQIRTPERWDKGLFKIEDDTHLHFIYRVETARWFDIFFVTRARAPAEPEVVLHIFRNSQLWSEPGRWRSATVPLSLFKRKVDGRFADVPPVAGEAPAQLFFSAEENGLQLTIDRIWVTRGGPGQLQINEVK